MNKKIKLILINILLITILLGINTVVIGKEDYYENTSEIEEIEYSEEYLEWEKLSDEQKKNTLEPRKEVISFDTLYDNENINENTIQAYNFEKETTPLRDNGVIFFMAQEETLERINTIPTSFNLSSKIGNVRAELQSPYNTCYAYPALNAIETNLELVTGNEYDFSEMHIEYMTSTLLGGDRHLDAGGNFETVMKYSFAKQGPVLESDIPKKDYTSSEYNTLKNAVQIAQVHSYKNFPTINKIKNTYSASEINEFRNVVKSHIMNYGAIFAGMYFCIDENELNYYNPETYAYSCIETDTTMNHGVTIVGWDDSYSKENFAEANRPSKDGAYIAINSWGESWGDNGYFYISYEDVWIEYNMSGVLQVEEIGPSIEFLNYTKTENNISVKVNVTDLGKSGINATTLKYLWTNSEEIPDENEFTNTFTNGETISIETTENLNLYILAKNKKGIKTIKSATAFVGGNGTETNPYLIETPEQLDAIRNNLSASYKLMNDIDLEFETQDRGGSLYNSGCGWKAIGTSSKPFTGTLDGNGYNVKNMYEDQKDYDRDGDGDVDYDYDGDGELDGVGLFGNNIGIVKNLGLYNCNISRYDTLGGISGINNGTIQNSYVSGILEGSINVGGIAGSNNGVIQNCYNTASVLGQTCIGGVVGQNNSNAQVINVYNVGHVGGSLEETVANLIGKNQGTIENAYYINEVLNAIGVDAGTSQNINNATINDMKNEATYNGFDFENMWEFNNSVDYNFATLKAVAHVEKEENTENFAGGNGTLYNPYKISTPEQLDFVRNDMCANYKLTNNIDLEYDTQNENGLFYNDGEGWNPLGHKGTRTTGNNPGSTGNYLNADEYKGVFDGNGYSILNLFVNRNDIGQALFTKSRGVLENFGLVNLDITGGTYSAGIVYGNYFIVQQVYTTGVTNGEGGIIGTNQGIIRNSFNTAYTHNGNGIAGECRGDYIVIENVYNAGRTAFQKTGDNTISKLPAITEISPGSNIKIQNVYALNNEINTEVMYKAYNNDFGEVIEDIDNAEVLTREELSKNENLIGFDFENTWKMIDIGSYKIPVLKNVDFINTNEENITEFAGGDGTYYNPYKISTPEQLNNVRNYLDKNFVLINDIDMQESISENGILYNEGKGFEPIGNEEEPFNGYFNGGKHKVINMKIYNDELTLVGLFGYTNEAVISNLQVINSKIKSGNEKQTCVGNIAGSIYRTIISNVGASGNIYDGFYVGGICGEIHCSLVEKSYNYSNVNSSENYVGGLVGKNNTYYGISLVYDCYNAGNVGYNKSNIAYNGDSAGICAYGGPILKNVYNIGTISTDSLNEGAIIVSKNNANFEGNVYYLDEGVPVYKYAGEKVENAYAKSKNEMKQQSTYEGFDFENVWKIEEGRFPTLKEADITYIEKITIDPVNILLGEEKHIEYNLIPKDAIATSLDYTLLDETIAKVNFDKVTGINTGTTSIIIKSKDELIENVCDVEVGDTWKWNISATNKDNVIATLDKNGILCISGTGWMKDWEGVLSKVPWYYERNNILKIIIEDGISNIGGGAFVECEAIISEIPTTIKEICEYAFYNFNTIENIILPEGIEKIGDYAFYSCDNLINSTLPSTVSNIGKEIFDNCSKLTKINVYCNSYAEEYVSTNYSDKLNVIHDYEEISRVEATEAEDGKIVYECTSCLDTHEEVIPKLGEEKELTSISVLNTPTKTEYIQNVENLDLLGGKLTLTYVDESTKEIDMTLEGVTVSGFDNTTLGEKTITVTYLDKTTTFVVNIVSCEHTYGEWNTTKEANCLEAGEKERTCSICNNVETEEISALGHSYNSVITEPTCTEEGYTTHTCTRCSDTYTDSETDAIGHNYGEWIVDKEATYLEEGHRYRECSNCGEKEEETIPKLSTDGLVEEWDISATDDDKVKASLFKEGNNYIIIISGTGNMKDFAEASKVPWSSYSWNLTKVVIEKGILSVGNYAFATQYGLKELELADTVATIGKEAFTWCKFTDLIMSDNIVSLGEGAFKGCSISNLRLSNGLKEISKDAFWDTSITKLEIPSSVETIGDSAFYSCSELIYIYIPENIKTIENQAFTNCDKLETVEIASGVTSIEGQAFTRCTNLRKITIPENVNVIQELTIENVGSASTYTSILDNCENVTVYCKSGSLAEAYCNRFELNYVIDDNNPTINVERSETDWTNQDVTITVTANDELSGLSKYAYSFDGGLTWQEESYKTYSEYTEGIVIKVKDCLYNTETYGEEITVYIDKVKPEINNVEISETEWTNQDVTITVNATDDLSGFGEESYSFDGGLTWQAENSKVYSENTSEIKIQIKDKAGNVTQYIEDINIENIDKVDPSIRVVTGERESCLSTVLTINATDNLSGFGAESYSFDNGVNWQGSNKKEYTQSEEDIVIQVKDRAGNVTTYTESIDIVIGHIEVIDRAVGATCTKTGLTEGKHCSRCTKILVAQEVVDAKGHTEVIDEGVEETCTEIGLTEGKHCSVCNEVLVAQEQIEKLGHDYESVATEPTCTEQGYTTHSCTRCDEEYIDTYIDATEHDYKISHKDDAVCEKGGKIVYECSKCKDTYEENIEANGHTEVIDEGVEATCTEAGLTEGKHCSICNEILMAQEQIEKLGHDYESVVTNPTCTEQGYTTHTCARCNDSYIDNETTALGHSFEEWMTIREPKCEETGEKERTCSICNTKETEVIDKLGHNYESIVTNPTCTEKGYTTHTCTRCLDRYLDRETEAKGHTEVIDAAVAATCTEAGLTEGKHCSICNEVLIKQETVETLGHNYGEWITKKEATCEENGVKEKTCSSCNAKETETINKLEHKYETVKRLPTCTTGGYNVHTCTKCSHSYTESETPALGHTYGEWSIIKEPTCEEIGEKERTCSECQKKETEKIEALGHEYNSVVTAPTCTVGGYTVHTCTRCSESYKDSETSALGHTYGEWSIIKEPTCEEIGEKERICNICQEAKEQDTIETLGHIYSEEWTVDVEATCTEVGSKSHHCTRENCDSKSDITEIPMIPHSYGAWIIDKEATYEEEGHKYRVCTICNVDSQDDVIPKLTEQELEVQTTYTVKEQDNKKYAVMSSAKEVQEILSNITSNKDLEIVDKSGNIIEDTAKVGTGAQVIEEYSKEVVYTIVVKGDADGDAKIDFIKDIIRFNNYRLYLIRLDVASILAGDVNEDGKIDFIKDIIRINNYRLGLINSL